MASTPSLLHLFLFFLVVGIASSSYIPKEVFEARGSVGRSLLQQKTTCSVDFEKLNYTVITSQCKGPNFSKERCCIPFKQLICPIKDQVNDEKTNCADSFFSHVNLYGKYPPGLFESLCIDDKYGVDCSNVPPLEQGKPKNGAGRVRGYSTVLTVLGAIVVMVLYI